MPGSSRSRNATATSSNMSRRPSRRRKAVSHYSDDNPSTFTVKRKKGDPPPPPPVTTTSTRGRRPQQPQQPQPQQQQQPQQHSTTGRQHSKTTSSSTTAPMTPKPTLPNNMTHHHHHHHHRRQVNVLGSAHKRKRMRVLPDHHPTTTIATSLQDDHLLAHAVSVQPVLPIPLAVPNQHHAAHAHASSWMSVQQEYPAIFGASVSTRPPPAAEWKQLPSAYQHGLLQRRGPAGTTIPVLPPAVTCWTLRQEATRTAATTASTSTASAAAFCAVGDCTGGVSLYDCSAAAGNPHATVLLHTTAWCREQERPLLSKKVISYPNAVKDVAWRGRAIVLRTATELEVFEIPTVVAWPLQQQQQPLWSETPCISLPLHTMAVLERQGRLDVLPFCFSSSSSSSDDADDRFVCDILWATEGNATLQTESTTTRTSHNNNHDEPTQDDVHPKAQPQAKALPSLVRIHVEASTTTSVAKHSLHPVQPVVAAAVTTSEKHGENGESSSSCSPLPLESFHCLTAIWDASKSRIQRDDDHADHDPILLTVAWTEPDRIDLLRCGAATGRIQDRVPTGWCLPNNNSTGTAASALVVAASAAAVADCQLQQSDDEHAHFTFLSGYKGIRLLQTSTLACLQVFGESVAVHGKTVTWRSCQWVRTANTAKQATSTSSSSSSAVDNNATVVRMQKKQMWLDRPDELARRYGGGGGGGGSGNHQQQSSTTTTATTNNEEQPPQQPPPPSMDDFWLVGVPHPFKGPDELSSTLYVWKPGVPNHPVTTLHAPAGGCLGLSVQTTNSTCSSNDDDYWAWKLTCATAETGQLWEWRAALQSNFAGVMYPTGYGVIQDNIEYIEDEDELDQAVLFVDEQHYHPHSPSGRRRSLSGGSLVLSPGGNSSVGDHNEDDDGLARALKLSLLDQPTQQQQQQLQHPNQKMGHGEDAMVCVVDDSDGDDSDRDDDDLARMMVMPCRPDLALFRETEDDNGNNKNSKTADSVVLSPGRLRSGSDTPSRNKRTGIDSELLVALPQMTTVRKAFGRAREQVERITQEHEQQQQQAAAAAAAAADQNESSAACFAAGPPPAPPPPPPPPRIKGKRTKVANVEALLQASIQPDLRRRMDRAQSVWASGAGSSSSCCNNDSRGSGNVVDCGGSGKINSATAAAAAVLEIPTTATTTTTTTTTTGVTAVAAVVDGEQHHDNHDNQSPSATTASRATAVTTARVVVVEEQEQRPPAAAEENNDNNNKSDKNAAGVPEEERSEPTAIMEPPTIRKDTTTNGVNNTKTLKKGLSIASRASEEEKELALELLLLSPRRSSTPSVDAAKTAPDMLFGDNHVSTENNNNKGKQQQDPPEESVVTPSEFSPAVASIDADHQPTGAADDDDNEKISSSSTSSQQQGKAAVAPCAACNGRMVMHVCGMREKPVDYEAIERAERERKEREAEEKHRLRMEKRRAADARRREARKKKKEEEERKRKEDEEKRREQEERLRRLEAEHFEEANIREHEDEPLPSSLLPSPSPSPHGFQPSFSPLSKQQGRRASGLSSSSSTMMSNITTTRVNAFSLQTSAAAAAAAHQTAATTTTSHSYHDASTSGSVDGYYYRGGGGGGGEEMNQSSNSHNNNNNMDRFTSVRQHSWSSSNRQGSFNAPSDTYSAASSAASTTRQETLRIDGTEVRPSTSLSASDALAALAGLADSLPAATSHTTAATTTTNTMAARPAPRPPAVSTRDVREAFPPAPASWYSHHQHEEEQQQQHDMSHQPTPPTEAHQQQEQQQHLHTSTNSTTSSSGGGSNYGYTGSRDRRTAIAEAFLGTFNMHGTTAAAAAQPGDSHVNNGNSYSGSTYSNNNNNTKISMPSPHLDMHSEESYTNTYQQQQQQQQHEEYYAQYPSTHAGGAAAMQGAVPGSGNAASSSTSAHGGYATTSSDGDRHHQQ